MSNSENNKQQELKQAEKARLKAEIKTLKEQWETLEVTYQRYNKSMRELQSRLRDIEEQQQKIAVMKWRAENELGIEQLVMW